MSLCRLVCGFAVVKALSAIYGPADFGTISQVMGIAALFFMLAGGGISNGLILELGREKEQPARLQWLASALEIAFGSAIVLFLTGLLLFALAADTLFGNRAPPALILGIAIAQAFVGIGNVLVAHASGVGNIRSFAAANILSTLLWAGLIVAITLVSTLRSSMWAVALTPAALGLVAAVLFRRSIAAALSYLPAKNAERRWRLLYASAFMIITVAAMPIASLIVRTDLSQRVSWEAVGFWQSVARLSDAYMQIFGVLIANFLFPKLVDCTASHERLSTLIRVGGQLIGLFLIGAVLLYSLRPHVITIAYSSAFLPASALIPTQLVGDLAKLTVWILVYNLMASGRLWMQPLAEIAQAVIFTAAYYILASQQQLAAPVTAHATACIVLTIALTVTTRLLINRRIEP
jgi:polysaccharide transporter, PST family